MNSQANQTGGRRHVFGEFSQAVSAKCVRRRCRSRIWGLGVSQTIATGLGRRSRLEHNVVQLRSDIEPLVRLLEETPRDQLLEVVGGRIHAGLNYRDLLAALLLAGVRNIQPRPEVGFKFHAVLVVNSAHLASLASPDEHRWLPIFWRSITSRTRKPRTCGEGDWTMSPVDESAVPSATNGCARLSSMPWIVGTSRRADAAIAGLARTAGVHEIFELMFRFGARDFRSIGHKAIYVSNSLRTLNCIGYEHAEPVLRSLAYALLMHEGDNPGRRDATADRPGRKNVERARRSGPTGWPANPIPPPRPNCSKRCDKAMKKTRLTK